MPPLATLDSNPKFSHFLGEFHLDFQQNELEKNNSLVSLGAVLGVYISLRLHRWNLRCDLRYPHRRLRGREDFRCFPGRPNGGCRVEGGWDEIWPNEIIFHPHGFPLQFTTIWGFWSWEVAKIIWPDEMNGWRDREMNDWIDGLKDWMDGWIEHLLQETSLTYPTVYGSQPENHRLKSAVTGRGYVIVPNSIHSSEGGNFHPQLFGPQKRRNSKPYKSPNKSPSRKYIGYGHSGKLNQHSNGTSTICDIFFGNGWYYHCN